MGGNGCSAEAFRSLGATLTLPTDPHIFRANPKGAGRYLGAGSFFRKPVDAMKIRNSLRSLRGRHRGNRLVRRKGRVYIINKTNRRYKARQG